MTSIRLFLAAALLAATFSTPAAAQGLSSRQTAVAPAAATAPMLSLQSVGVRRVADAPAPSRNPAPFRADTKQNRGLMILGGAGMLTGAVIGGDAGSLISVGGAVVFLWGLYQYVK